MHEVIASRLIPQCERICGAIIDGVTYDVLRDEAVADHIGDPDFYLGGDVILSFRKADPLYVSWARIARWHDKIVYSLTVGLDSLFTPGSLQSLQASETEIWSSHIGQAINLVRLYGDDGVPFVLSIQTRSGTILIGSSYQTRFGDGDDVFISNDTNTIKDMPQIWQSQRAE